MTRVALLAVAFAAGAAAGLAALWVALGWYLESGAPPRDPWDET